MTQNLLSIRNDTLDLSHGKALYSHCTHNSKILWLLFPTSVGRLGYRISLSGKCFSRTTPNIIVRTLQAGRINHMYSSQNSLILCFIILILNGSYNRSHAWISPCAAIARMIHFHCARLSPTTPYCAASSPSEDLSASRKTPADNPSAFSARFHGNNSHTSATCVAI